MINVCESCKYFKQSEHSEYEGTCFASQPILTHDDLCWQRPVVGIQDIACKDWRGNGN